MCERLSRTYGACDLILHQFIERGADHSSWQFRLFRDQSNGIRCFSVAGLDLRGRVGLLSELSVRCPPRGLENLRGE